jgi:hypothetical protein
MQISMVFVTKNLFFSSSRVCVLSKVFLLFCEILVKSYMDTTFSYFFFLLYIINNQKKNYLQKQQYSKLQKN